MLARGDGLMCHIRRPGADNRSHLIAYGSRGPLTDAFPECAGDPPLPVSGKIIAVGPAIKRMHDGELPRVSDCGNRSKARRAYARRKS